MDLHGTFSVKTFVGPTPTQQSHTARGHGPHGRHRRHGLSLVVGARCSADAAGGVLELASNTSTGVGAREKENADTSAKLVASVKPEDW